MDQMLSDILPCRLREGSREPEGTGREGGYARLGIRAIVRKAEMHPSPKVSISRRRLIGSAVAAGSLASIGGTRRALAQASGPFSLPPLPYPEDALAPVISGTTIGFHYGKHHRAYVDNLNKAVEGTDLAHKSLEEIVKATAGDPTRIGV